MSWLCSCFAKTYETPEVLELDYRHCSLTEVPSDVFAYEQTLERLDLGCNQISDLPPSVFHCHELKELDLCDNDLMHVPSAIGTLTKLQKLDLSRNGISEIPDTIKGCKHLQYLDLSLNRLQKVPEGISQLVNLEELFLNDTYLEFLNANFGRLTKLHVLELRDNSLQALPKSMNRFQQLQRMDLGQNELSELPEVIGAMTNLTELWCDNNSIQTLPKFIGNLHKLSCLDASQNDIQEISEDIGKCTQLSDLTMAFNALEALPESFTKLEHLTVLRLDNNSIQYLPEEFGHLKNLREFSLIRNLLKSLPSTIGLMRKLRTLYLDDNLLTELPKEIGSCSALSILSVAKNRLVSIPSEVGHLSNLRVLTLPGNLIKYLPVSLLNIEKLHALWLSESQSKPLPPLNKEVDRVTGQHVLTCYLLPQLPVTQEVDYATKEETKPSRRSGTCIKFNTDPEPPPVETNIIKRGLLRAPTPYPKELRALAKHASNLRQSVQNGDLVIHDEPEYEGDVNGVLEAEAEEIHSTRMSNRSYHTIGLPPVEQIQLQPLLHKREIPAQATAIDTSGSKVRSYTTTDYSATDIGYTRETYHSNTFSSINSNDVTSPLLQGDRAQDSVPVEASTVITSSDMPYRSVSKEEPTQVKEPPPYHVAARRAAFFRSVPSSPASSVGYPSSSSPTFTSISSRSTPPASIVNEHITSRLSANDNIPLASQVEERNLGIGASAGYSATSEAISYNGPSTQFHLNNVDLSSPVQDQDSEGKAIQALLTAAESAKGILSTGAEPATEEVQAAVIEKTELVEQLVNQITSAYVQAMPSISSSSASVIPNVEVIDSGTVKAESSIVPTTVDFVDSLIGVPPPDVPSNTSRDSNHVTRVRHVAGVSDDLVALPHDDFPPPPPEMMHPTENVEEPRSTHEPDPDQHSSIPLPTSSSANPPRPAIKPKPVTPNGSKIPGLSFENRPPSLRRNYKIPESSIPRSITPERSTTPTSNLPVLTSRIPKANEANHQQNAVESVDNGNRRNTDQHRGFERTPSGSRIPKFKDKSSQRTKSPEAGEQLCDDNMQSSTNTSVDMQQNAADGNGNSRIPTSRKPWIFGTHKNARVVPLEYVKTDDLGFSVSPGNSGPHGGIYVDSVQNANSTVKLGDKLLQVDGIDVSQMTIEIVRKILSNCQETIHLLVSRQY